MVARRDAAPQPHLSRAARGASGAAPAPRDELLRLRRACERAHSRRSRFPAALCARGQAIRRSPPLRLQGRGGRGRGAGACGRRGRQVGVHRRPAATQAESQRALPQPARHAPAALGDEVEIHGRLGPSRPHADGRAGSALAPSRRTSARPWSAPTRSTVRIASGSRCPTATSRTRPPAIRSSTCSTAAQVATRRSGRPVAATPRASRATSRSSR